MEYEDQLKAEVETWNIEDEAERHEKIQRETIRHHKLVKDLLLDKLATHRMDILEVGGGPYPVSDLIQFRSRIVVDPCTDEYKKYFPCPDHINKKIEEIEFSWAEGFDLVIATNSLDHVDNVQSALYKIDSVLRPGGFAAIMCAENNALTNPHPCHEHNLTASKIHYYLDHAYETVWELTYEKDNYRYGWVEYEGKRGQPAFAILLRKCTGYN
jgi:SAM-dependent methyltransferase